MALSSSWAKETGLTERGCVIAFEGVEGAGKSTQVALTAAALRRRSIGVVETREPGGTLLGRELRRLLMHVPEGPQPLAELFLYLADRAQHVGEVILPALAAGQVVLTDRFLASTIAYQGYGRGLDVTTVSRLEAIARQGVAPRLTLVLDVPVAAGLQRAHGDDRFHREAEAFHERVRRGFLRLAEHDPDHYCIIDGTGAEEAVQEQVLAAVMRTLARR